MKAVRIHEHGGPEVLRYEDAEEPRPTALIPDRAPTRSGSLEIKVRSLLSGSLNRLDLFVRTGMESQMTRIPF